MGDGIGMPAAHVLASGMGGIRTAGDLVARVMFRKKLRIKDAKTYVAKKLGLDVVSIADEYTMREVREELDIGVITAVPGVAKGIEAKTRIAEILNIDILSVDRLKKKSEAKAAAAIEIEGKPRIGRT